MARLFYLPLILLSASLAFSDRIDTIPRLPQIPQISKTNDTVDEIYHDLICSNVYSCYCYLNGEDYQATCSDPLLDVIPDNLSYNITVLYVTGTLLDTITADHLEPYSFLRVLDLSENQLTTVAPDALALLIDIEEFIIRGNKLVNIPDNVVLENNQLALFDGRQNNLTSMPNFANLENLQEVLLSENKINVLSSSHFDGCSSLLTISLSMNNLVSIPANAFNGALNLELLDLSSNKITTIAAASFNGLTNVKNIVLRSNQISAISTNVFSGSPQLWELDLSVNMIGTLTNNAFQGLNNLTYLRLNDNELSIIPIAPLQALPAIRTLHLGANLFSTIPSSAFINHPYLKDLFLDGMDSLISIEIGAFQGLTGLEQLSIANNQNLLTFIPAQLPYEHVPNIKFLYLNGDGFVYLDEALFSDKPELVLVELFDNKFNCSCDLKWMPRVVIDGEPWASHWATSGTPPRCHTPWHLEGWSIPTMLEADMTCERLEMTSVSPTQQTTHLKSPANFTVHLYKGLPSSVWIPPDGRTVVPFPDLGQPLDRLRYATWSLIENNVIVSTLYLTNSSLTDQGTYTIMATNIAGNDSMSFQLQVLPYELTTPTPVYETTEPQVGAATCMTYHTTLIVAMVTIVHLWNIA